MQSSQTLSETPLNISQRTMLSLGISELKLAFTLDRTRKLDYPKMRLAELADKKGKKVIGGDLIYDKDLVKQWLSVGAGVPMYEKICEFNEKLNTLLAKHSAESEFQDALWGESTLIWDEGVPCLNENAKNGILNYNPELLLKFLEKYPDIERFLFDKLLTGDNFFHEANQAIKKALEEVDQALNAKGATTSNEEYKVDGPKIRQAFFNHGKMPAHERFNFNWNDYKTIALNQGIVEQVASYVKASSLSENKNEEQKIGRLAYLVGTFYNHIKCQPDAALENLVIAEKILQGDELVWVWMHIAFSYLQKLMVANLSGDSAEKEKNKLLVKKYHDKVVVFYDPKEKPDSERIKILGFANCIKGLLYYEYELIKSAIQAYQNAFILYDEHGVWDDQYFRARNCYAMILAADGNSAEALEVFYDVEQYWQRNHNTHSIYAARFYVSYGDFLKKYHPGRLSMAMQRYTAAYQILVNLEGKNSPFSLEVRQKRMSLQAELNGGDSIAPAAAHGLYSVAASVNPAVNGNNEVKSRDVNMFRF